MRAVGLFSGVGGFELGLGAAGITTELLCESWDAASAVLRRRFSAPLASDVRLLSSLPSTDVVTAGFPCTDLSQVGRTSGIGGAESGLVGEVFRLVGGNAPTWLVLENVPNMLSLHGGAAMHHITEALDDLGWNWAYRVVDSRHFGVRQRRRRVFLVASPSEDPRQVLFADETEALPALRPDAYGFSWTEGNRGLGWGHGVTPTLKGGSGVGIASPPAVWRPEHPTGHAIVRPSIAAGERLQGFRAGWTADVPRLGERWKLVGNAVTVPVAEWIGGRLLTPGELVEAPRRPLNARGPWPSAAASMAGQREAWKLSERPTVVRPRHSLGSLLASHGSEPLSRGATAGFLKRLRASSLHTVPHFVRALDAHVKVMPA